MFKELFTEAIKDTKFKTGDYIVCVDCKMPAKYMIQMIDKKERKYILTKNQTLHFRDEDMFKKTTKA